MCSCMCSKNCSACIKWWELHNLILKCSWIMHANVENEFQICWLFYKAWGSRGEPQSDLYFFFSSYPLNIVYYLWSQHNYMKYCTRIRHHGLRCMTDDFHSFTYCAGIPEDFLLNISTWSTPFYPANPRCRITMGEGLKIMNLKNYLSTFRNAKR